MDTTTYQEVQEVNLDFLIRGYVYHLFLREVSPSFAAPRRKTKCDYMLMPYSGKKGNYHE